MYLIKLYCWHAVTMWIELFSSILSLATFLIELHRAAKKGQEVCSGPFGMEDHKGHGNCIKAFL